MTIKAHAVRNATKPCTCANRTPLRDERYDAYYCTKCMQWLEAGCTDPRCEFCRDRPSDARACEGLT